MIVATPMPPTGVRTPFESIQSQFGPAEAAVIAHMRRVLKVGSFALSRERGTARATKHAYLRRSGFNCAYLPDAAQALMALQEPERARCGLKDWCQSCAPSLSTAKSHATGLFVP